MSNKFSSTVAAMTLMGLGSYEGRPTRRCWNKPPPTEAKRKARKTSKASRKVNRK